jgi:hypothetical protein
VHGSAPAFFRKTGAAVLNEIAMKKTGGRRIVGMPFFAIEATEAVGKHYGVTRGYEL